ncbi:site-2 protease family protein [Hymenobacter cellulosilyticus]|uniref:Site-2 protease family protein n=1 Tax=Hymenobacter cellulosilyticus TaxID=2932248 RepID=A0A8T9QH36_9BACT|nr:site-2 protease family protein [Hymenobacter cellulosilyticus]UOQ74889.1 site-2 protease family protein [Hymenobacter cellulosilyticus]
MPSLPLPDAPAPESLPASEPEFDRYERPEPPRWRVYSWHLLLFLLTLLTTTLAGAEWMTNTYFFTQFSIDDPRAAFRLSGWLSQQQVLRGLWFSVPFLGVLTVHEFGHYFTARYYRVRASLPYYIPFFTGAFSTIGTFGAVIRIKDRIFSRKEFFDIGLAGPLAGFLVAVPVLIYGFTHLPALPPPVSEQLLEHSGLEYGITLSRPLLYRLLESWFADPTRLPALVDLPQYPVLLAGSLALFFTALNLLPIGQLDGGHILYGLLGFRRFNRLSVVFFVGFIFYAGLGIFSFNRSVDFWLYGGVPYLLYLYLVFRSTVPTVRRTVLLLLSVLAGQLALTLAVPGIEGNPGWLVFGLLLGRFTGIFHPPAPDERALSLGRKVLGWVMLAIFVLCFSPSPFAFL